jgi:hypothetical protein
MKYRKTSVIIPLLMLMFGFFSLKGQQSRTLFFRHEVAQSSFLNPAVPLNCGWSLGLPIVSSVHLNYGNNFTTFNQAFKSIGDGIFQTNLYNVEQSLHRNNFAATELHLQLLGLGYRFNEWSLMFSVIEKNNTLSNVPQDLFLLALHGNRQFEGERASFNRTSVFMNHYSELALSVAREEASGLRWGIRGKVLFGKVNVSTSKSLIGMLTDGTYFDLDFESHLNIRTSMPGRLEIDNNKPGDFIQDEGVTASDILTELGNPGAAIDFGVILPLESGWNVSASLIDLGFINWRKNLHGYQANGRFVYQGSYNNGADTDDFWNDLGQMVTDSIQITTDEQSYTTFLPPRLSIGASRELNSKFQAEFLVDGLLYRTKLITGAYAGLAYSPFTNFTAVVSMAYQYYTLKNLGFGFVWKLQPFQLYAMSDNVLGFIAPYDTRNINLRVGLNLMFGCDKGGTTGSRARKGGIAAMQGNCGWVKEEPKKRKRR